MKMNNFYIIGVYYNEFIKHLKVEKGWELGLFGH